MTEMSSRGQAREPLKCPTPDGLVVSVTTKSLTTYWWTGVHRLQLGEVYTEEGHMNKYAHQQGSQLSFEDQIFSQTFPEGQIKWAC